MNWSRWSGTTTTCITVHQYFWITIFLEQLSSNFVCWICHQHQFLLLLVLPLVLFQQNLSDLFYHFWKLPDSTRLAQKGKTPVYKHVLDLTLTFMAVLQSLSVTGVGEFAHRICGWIYPHPWEMAAKRWEMWVKLYLAVRAQQYPACPICLPPPPAPPPIETCVSHRIRQNRRGTRNCMVFWTWRLG